MVAGPAAGDFRLVWQDDRNGPRAWNTWYARSADGGVTWSAAVRLSDRGGGAKYKHRYGYDFPFGDYLGLAVDSQGVNHAIWGEGFGGLRPRRNLVDARPATMTRSAATLHITNGDGALYLLKKAGILGTHLAWRDALNDGPVPAGLSLEETSTVRANYLAQRGYRESDPADPRLRVGATRSSAAPETSKRSCSGSSTTSTISCRCCRC